MRFALGSLHVLLIGMFFACGGPVESESTQVSQAKLTQDWESGASGWTDGNGQPPTLVSDSQSPAGPTVQQLDNYGDYFSPLVDVVGGQTYCLRANIKWVSGGVPSLSVEQNANGAPPSVSLVVDGMCWCAGGCGANGCGANGDYQHASVELDNPGWQAVRADVILNPDTTQIRLLENLSSNENLSKEGPPLSYLDGLSLDSGSCWSLQYTQDWELGDGDWKDGSGQAPNLVSDTSSPAGQSVQQLDRATAGGDYFSPMLDAVANQTYCVRAKLKWVSGAAPFVGVQQYTDYPQDVNWLIGTRYTDPKGTTAVVSSTETGWQEFAQTLITDYYVTGVRLVDELWSGSSKGGDSLAYFDALSISSGSCSPIPYTEDWESGVRSWTDWNGQTPTLVNDSSAPAGPTVQQIDRATLNSGETLSPLYASPFLDVVGGLSYCIRGNVKWVSGAAPFVGVAQYTT